MFRFFAQELTLLQDLAQEEALALWCGDDSAFHLNPHGLYAWQASESEATLPAQRVKALNVLGFINMQNQGEFYDFNHAMTAALFIECVEDFIDKRVQKKTILIIDRSSAHYAQAVQDKMQEWKKKNLWIQYLPAYCSALNLIENLWRKIKYQWLTVADFLSAQKLREKVYDILKNFGK